MSTKEHTSWRPDGFGPGGHGRDAAREGAHIVVIGGTGKPDQASSTGSMSICVLAIAGAHWPPELATDAEHVAYEARPDADKHGDGRRSRRRHGNTLPDRRILRSPISSAEKPRAAHRATRSLIQSAAICRRPNSMRLLVQVYELVRKAASVARSDRMVPPDIRKLNGLSSCDYFWPECLPARPSPHWRFALPSQPIVAQDAATFYQAGRCALWSDLPRAAARRLRPALARTWPSHSGHPLVVVQNMPGAASVKSVQYLSAGASDRRAPDYDVHPGLITQSLTAPEKVNVKFLDYAWIGKCQ